jgi:uncharacterized oxidoreductase
MEDNREQNDIFNTSRRSMLVGSVAATIAAGYFASSSTASAQAQPAASPTPTRPALPAGGNTILITGGSSGIGRALAEQLHARGDTVIIAARRTAVLQDIASRFPNMHAMTVDVRDPFSVKRLAREIAEKHSALNVVFNNAGIMRPENVFDGDSALAESSDHIETNLNGPIRLTAALLPHLAKQPRARIVNTSSGLAFVPRAAYPTYCATKAGVHSYTVSLRHQLRRTSIDVLELAPPALRTELTPGQSRIEAFMPLDDFINEVLGLLDRNPVPDELIVERAKIQRLAEAEGRFFQTFEAINRADG